MRFLLLLFPAPDSIPWIRIDGNDGGLELQCLCQAALQYGRFSGATTIDSVGK